MASVDSLPAELIRHTLRLGAAHLSFDERYDFLFAAAFVCRSWREHAQAELWDVVTLESTSQLCSFLILQNKVRRTTRQLVFRNIGLPDCWVGLHVEAVLRASKGVTKLEISQFYPFEPGYLCQPSTKDLRSLHLTHTIDLPHDYEEKPPPTLICPFQLSHLSILAFDPSIPHILRPLLPQAALSSLRLVYGPNWMGDAATVEAEAWAVVCPLLISLAPQLRKLELVTSAKDEGLAQFDPFLEALVNLRHLVSFILCVGSLHHIPSKLESWTVKAFAVSRAKEVLFDALECVEALSELKRLRIELGDPKHAPIWRLHEEDDDEEQEEEERVAQSGEKSLGREDDEVPDKWSCEWRMRKILRECARRGIVVEIQDDR